MNGMEMHRTSRFRLLVLFTIVLAVSPSILACRYLGESQARIANWRAQRIDRAPLNDPIKQNRDADSTDEQSNRVSRTVTLNDGIQVESVTFDDPYLSLGTVVSRLAQRNSNQAMKLDLSNRSVEESLISLKREMTSIILPYHFAVNTDARLIAVEDNDSISLISWEQALGAPNPMAPIQEQLKALETEFEEMGFQFTATERTRIDEPFLNTMIAIWKIRNPLVANRIQQIKNQNRDLLDQLSREISIQLTGLVKENKKWNIHAASRMSSILARREFSIRNNIPANIVVLARNQSMIVLPLRKQLGNTIVPDRVQHHATSEWTQAFVANGDHFHFTRLALFQPVIDGKIKSSVAIEYNRIQQQRRLTEHSLRSRQAIESRGVEPNPFQVQMRKMISRFPSLF